MASEEWKRGMMAWAWWWRPWPQKRRTRRVLADNAFHEADIARRYMLEHNENVPPLPPLGEHHDAAVRALVAADRDQRRCTAPSHDSPSEVKTGKDKGAETKACVADAMIIPLHEATPLEFEHASALGVTLEEDTACSNSSRSSEHDREQKVLQLPVSPNFDSLVASMSPPKGAQDALVPLVEQTPAPVQDTEIATQRELVLIVYDFDDTILDGNSDLVPMQRFYPRLMHFISDELRKDIPWTEIMNSTLHKIQRRGVGADDICAAVADTPLNPGMRELIVRATASKGVVSAQAIISDSNTLYIDAVLTRHQLQGGSFKHIYTNKAHVHEGQFTIQPYADPTTETSFPARCAKCPANLCKGKVLAELLIDKQKELNSRPIVVYIGDGGNDLCPGTRLLSSDFLCPRSGFKLANLLKASPELCRATVLPWSTGHDIQLALSNRHLL